MTDTFIRRVRRVMGLHALAHDIANGTRPTGIRWYHPHPATHLNPVPVLPEAVHGALCPSTAVNLTDEAQHLHICDECHVAVEDAA